MLRPRARTPGGNVCLLGGGNDRELIAAPIDVAALVVQRLDKANVVRTLKTILAQRR